MSQSRGYGGPRKGGGGRRPDRREPPTAGRLPPGYSRTELEAVFGSLIFPPPPAVANPGLVFDRFLKIWQSDIELVKERLGPLKAFVQGYQALKPELEPLLLGTHERLKYVAPASELATKIAVTEERFVSGLGTSHPLENGFCFDHTLGVPHLPGSSVKGLCRQVAELEGNEQLVVELFGTGDEDDHAEKRDAAVGDIVFLPAYPAQWPQLDVDVVNCHQREYYGSDPIVLPSSAGAGEVERNAGKQTKGVGPLEVEDPVPVFFLAVAKGTKFVFRCFSRSHQRSNADQALGLLVEGLEGLGIGAKTALGYGVMAESQ